MFYLLLKQLFRLLIWAFYRSIHVEHQDRVPSKGPVILVSNHPNTMMDPVLLALFSGRNPHFLGKSTLFSSPVTRWFFGQGKVIPIYRKSDAASEMHKNIQTFSRCYEALEQGAAIVIMPEGLSQLDGTLHPIKTGTARIALETEARNGFRAGVTIIPAGINYADPTRFNQDVHCRFGKPIPIAEFKEHYASDPMETVYELTEQIRTALEKLTTTVRAPEHADILEHLSLIYKQELITDMGLEQTNKSDEFSVTRGMADAIDWFTQHEPVRANRLQRRMRSYLAKLEGLELRNDLLSTKAGKRTFLLRAGHLLLVIFGAPFHFYGVLNNILPYRVPRLVVKRLKPTIEFRSTYILVSGLVAFLGFYLLQSLLVWFLTANPWWTLLYVASLLPSGKFSLYYLSLLHNYRQHMRLLTLFTRRKNLLFEVIEERVQLIQALNDARQLYMEMREAREEDSPDSRTGGDGPET